MDLLTLQCKNAELKHLKGICRVILKTHVTYFILCWSVRPLLSTHCRYRALLLHLITLSDVPLDEGSARRRELYPHNTQHYNAPGGNRTRNPSKRAVVGPRLRRLAHRDRCYVGIQCIFQFQIHDLVNNSHRYVFFFTVNIIFED